MKNIALAFGLILTGNLVSSAYSTKSNLDDSLLLEDIDNQQYNFKNIMFSNDFSIRNKEPGCCKGERYQIRYRGNTSTQPNQIQIEMHYEDQYRSSQLQQILYPTKTFNVSEIEPYVNMFCDNYLHKSMEVPVNQAVSLVLAATELFKMKQESRNAIRELISNKKLERDSIIKIEKLIRKNKFSLGATYTCWLGTLSFNQNGQDLGSEIRNIIPYNNAEEFNTVIKYVVESIFLANIRHDFHVLFENCLSNKRIKGAMNHLIETYQRYRH